MGKIPAYSSLNPQGLTQSQTQKGQVLSSF